jgi:hypothetical protein
VVFLILVSRGCSLPRLPRSGGATLWPR